MEILVDSNVILDIVTEDKMWYSWSSETLAFYADNHRLVINPIIFAEVSIGFARIEEVEEVLLPSFYRRDHLPWEAAYLAGKCFLKYRKRGGEKRSPLSDFYIGGHAVVAGISLLTRDPTRYRTYFPNLNLIAPEKSPEAGS